MSSFHSNNVDCILYIGAASSTASVDALPAYGSETFAEVGLTGKIKLPKYEKSVGRFNVLNDANKRAVGGKLGDQDISGDLVLDDTDATHDTMFADMQTAGNVYRNWKVVTPTGEQHFAKGFVSSWDRDEYNAEGDAKEIHVAWNVAVSGAVTVV